MSWSKEMQELRERRFEEQVQRLLSALVEASWVQPGHKSNRDVIGHRLSIVVQEFDRTR